jgi:hypothetical protein
MHNSDRKAGAVPSYGDLGFSRLGFKQGNIAPGSSNPAPSKEMREPSWARQLRLAFRSFAPSIAKEPHNNRAAGAFAAC